MRRIIFFSIFIIFFFYTPFSFSVQFQGTPDVYEVTINKVELYNSTISSWVVVGEGDMTFDIAKVSAGGIVGSYITDKPLPEGTYTKVRVRISRTMRIKGSASYGGNTYYTTTSTQSFGNQGQAVVISTTGPAQTGAIIVPADENPPSHIVDGDYFIETNDLPSPFTITKGVSKKLKIKFDVSGVLTFDNTNNICWCEPPSVSHEVE